ncbi:MAG: hypothetical protein JWP00_2644 [Chloroflexi bacterium]|nr:hypothetical protein [Chloroflexota bacterium]
MKAKVRTKPLLCCWLIALGLAVLLSACGETTRTARPANPCVITEFKPAGTNGLGKENPTTLVLDKSSPEYCQNVRDDYKAAMAWYQTQVANDTYAPTMSVELANYYTGELLGEARSGLFYNKQAGRVVLGRFNPQALTIQDQKWAKDGFTSTLIVKPGSYSLVSISKNAPNQAQETEGGQFESWEVTLVYDDAAKRWKISSAKTIYTSAGG